MPLPKLPLRRDSYQSDRTVPEALTVHPVCQEELYNPGRDVSINPNEDSILTP